MKIEFQKILRLEEVLLEGSEVMVGEYTVVRDDDEFQLSHRINDEQDQYIIVEQDGEVYRFIRTCVSMDGYGGCIDTEPIPMFSEEEGERIYERLDASLPNIPERGGCEMLAIAPRLDVSALSSLIFSLIR